MTYLIRVQLKGSPSNETFQELHRRMERIGFGREIESAEPRWYWLPHATYLGESALEPVELCDEVSVTIAPLYNEARILVAETSRLAWSGLAHLNS